MVMEDLQHILPDQVKRHFTGRKLQIILIAAIGVLSFLTITFVCLYAFKHVEVNALNSNGPSAAALTGNDVTCMSATCLKASAWMLKNMDAKANPCEDFYRFSCGAWNDRINIPPETGYQSVKYKIWGANEERLRDAIEKPIKRKEANSSERKLKDFFMSCLHDYGRFKEGGLVLVDIIRNHLGGWYVFNPDTFADNWDFTNAMKVAHSEYLTDILFKVDVYPDFRERERNVIAVRRGGLGMYYTYYDREDKAHIQQAYKDYIAHIAHLLAWDGNATATGDVIDQFVEDVFYQEKQIAQGMIAMRSTPNWWASHHASIAELQRNYSQVNWLPIMQAVFGDDITSNTDVYVRQQGYFQFVNQLLANETQNKTRIMNNYIVWRVIDEYAYHLSWDYKYAGFIFHEKYTGQELYLPTWEHCLGTVEYRLGAALAALFLNEYVGTSGKKAGEDMVGELRRTLNATIDEIPWMDNVTRARAKEKMEHTESLVGFPGEYFNSTFIDSMHSSLRINQSYGYFRNLLNINNFTKMVYRMELNTGRHFQMWKYLMSGGTFGVSPFFYWSFQTLIVPSGAMVTPQFHKGDTGFISYATLGTLVAEQMANTINYRGRYMWHNGTFVNWWTLKTTANYTVSKLCMQEAISKKQAGPYLINGENVTVPIGPYSAGAVISDIMGVETAYKAYQKLIPGKHLLPGLNMTNQQAFFFASAQMRCSTYDDETAYMHTRAGYMPDNILVNEIMMHMPEFSNAFNCPVGSVMNPKDKCDVL